MYFTFFFWTYNFTFGKSTLEHPVGLFLPHLIKWHLIFFSFTVIQLKNEGLRNHLSMNEIEIYWKCSPKKNSRLWWFFSLVLFLFGKPKNSLMFPTKRLNRMRMRCAHEKQVTKPNQVKLKNWDTHKSLGVRLGLNLKQQTRARLKHLHTEENCRTSASCVFVYWLIWAANFSLFRSQLSQVSHSLSDNDMQDPACVSLSLSRSLLSVLCVDNAIGWRFSYPPFALATDAASFCCIGRT